MGTIRVEFVPIKKYNLGLLGLDHLQIVYEDENSFINKQDNWYVLEGTHDGGLLNGSLGVSGEEVFTELAAANGEHGDELVELIGTPEITRLPDCLPGLERARPLGSDDELRQGDPGAGIPLRGTCMAVLAWCDHRTLRPSWQHCSMSSASTST